jgi:hypothetical protein
MKNITGSRVVWVAVAVLALSFGSNAFAKAKPKPSGLTQFVGAYAGTITFPTKIFGGADTINYSGPGILIVTAKGKKATLQFICTASAPLATGTSVSMLSKLTSNGKFTTNGTLSGEKFNPTKGKFKVHGKKLTSSAYSFVAPSSASTLTWGVSYKLSGKSVTASGPATFTYFGFTSPGTFTFKGKRLLE